MIANAATPSATFTAIRRELVGHDVLLGAAELARGVRRTADRRLCMLAIGHERMRRVDVWLTDDAAVSQAVADDDSRSLIGSVCARQHADALVGSIIESLIGSMPQAAGSDVVELPAVAPLTPDALPRGVMWVLIVSALTDSNVERWMTAATPTGLVGGAFEDPGAPLRLDPIGPLPTWSRIVRLIGQPVMSPPVGPD